VSLADQQINQNIIFRDGQRRASERRIAVEVPVAISYRGSTQAVLMASPNRLSELGIGFSITEAIVPDITAILDTEVLETDLGFEIRVEIADDHLENLQSRRRFMAGPVGCGLCGIDSLEQAVRVPPMIADHPFTLTPADIAKGLRLMSDGQVLNSSTRAVHAAAFVSRDGELVEICEDVGRHNAFDKLIGACLVRNGFDSHTGAVFVSSRLSVEMVQKAAYFGVPVLAAVSAPTSLAIRVAQDIGLTLVAVARDDDFEVFTHAQRILF
jgi:FdhD protein